MSKSNLEIDLYITGCSMRNILIDCISSRIDIDDDFITAVVDAHVGENVDYDTSMRMFTALINQLVNFREN